MTFAEQQRLAHLERQRRLGKTVPTPPRPPFVQAPPLAPQAEPMLSLSPAKMIEALQREVARLTKQLKAVEREDRALLVTSHRIRPVISAVAKYYGVSLRDIVARRRTREYLRPRHVAMYLAKRLTKHSLPALGRVFERDHTTVLHGCRRIAKLRRQDPELDAEINALLEWLTPGGTPHD